MTSPAEAAAPPGSVPLLKVHGLTKHFRVSGGMLLGAAKRRIHALNGLTFAIAPGEVLALVGESGCGKTTVARTIVGLYQADEGTVRFRGRDLASLWGRERRRARRAMQLVFQDPFGSLNPRLPVGAIIAEPLKIAGEGPAAARREKVAAAMAQVGLSPADADRYPHEFSGGQRQRIAIARALVSDPALIIADEPLSALDVSIQSQILNLLKDLQADRGLAFLFISHDLAVVNHFADRVAVMYLGHVVEIAPRDSLFAAPRHPYTRALIDAVPVPGGGKRRPGTAPRGDVPSPIDPPPGCPFHPRCPRAVDACRTKMPPLEPLPGAPAGHLAACHNPLPADRPGSTDGGLRP